MVGSETMVDRDVNHVGLRRSEVTAPLGAKITRCHVCLQEQVSESTTITVLDKLSPDTRYTITVVPVYAEGDGPSLSDSGKTSEFIQRIFILPQRGQQAVWPKPLT